MKTLVAAFLSIAFSSLSPGQVNQSTMLGQIQLAEAQRGQVDPSSSILNQHIAIWENSNGGPVLQSIGVQLGDVMGNAYAKLFMSVIMTLMVAASWLKAMRESSALGELAATLTVKFIVGIAVFLMPGLVYGVGMTIRDLGTIIASLAFTNPTVGPTLSKLSLSASPEEMSFERLRAMAIDRAVQDLSQPMNGVGADVAYYLYDQMVARAVAVAQPSGGAAPSATSLGLQTIGSQGSALEKSRVYNANISKLLQILDRTDPSQAFVYTTYRVGPNGLPDIQAGSNGGGFDVRTAAGISALTEDINASTVTITSGSINYWLVAADNIRTAFEQQAAQGAFSSKADYDAAYQAALESYGNVVYIQTGGFIKKTFWENLAFACGAAGGTTWSYLGNYSKSDQQAIGAAQKNLSNWYQSTTGRAASSFSPAPPAESALKGLSKFIMDWLSFFRDKIITNVAMVVFDLIIEVYVFVIWLAYPLWFYSGTAKAFTGALNIFTMACLTPTVFTFLFLIWDAVAGYMISLSLGS
jgi:hypothetical protein